MKAGKYFVGDLCYVFPTGWDAVHGTFFLKQNENNEYELPDGRKFAMVSTQNGDGLYVSNLGIRFAVDSGSIGCILFDDLKEWDACDDFGDLNSYGTVYEFKEDFELVRASKIEFGNEIYIDDSSEYDEDDDDGDNWNVWLRD